MASHSLRQREAAGHYVLHIGTTRVSMAYLRSVGRGVKEVLQYASRPADGFEHGVVKDFSRASDAIRACLKDVVQNSGESLIPCRVLVSNVHIRNFTFSSSLYFYGNSHPITMKDVRDVIAQTRSVATIPLNEMIVQTLPQEFLVDDLSGITNPIGLEATRIGVTLRIFTTDYAIYHNLTRVMERVDLDAREFIPVSLASACAVLTDDEQKEGVVLVKAGGHVTHIDCYKNQVLLSSKSVPFGSEMITESLAKHFSLRSDEARRLKEQFVSCAPKQQFEEELIPILGTDGKVTKHVSRKDFQNAIMPACSEFISQIAMEVCSVAAVHSPVMQVVFTGGGAKLDGFIEALQEKVPHAMRIGRAANVEASDELRNDPSLSGIIGSLDYSSFVIDPAQAYTKSNNVVKRMMGTAKRWVEEYF